MSPRRGRIVVTGLVGLHPVGGVAWDYLQYVIGLSDMGYDVVYHEDTWCWPFDPVKNANTDDPSYSVAFLSRFFETYAPHLRDKWHYRHLRSSSHGLSEQQFREFARTADVYLNISGAGILPEELTGGCIKVFVDTDPGYNQVVMSERPSWSANVDRWCQSVLDHDVHMTYGESIGTPRSQVPTAGLDWRPTRMPVVLRLWEEARSRPPREAAWRTVMTWNAFGGPLSYKGVPLGSKGTEFGKLLHLPRRGQRRLEIAVGGMGVPMGELAAAGWSVLDGPVVTRTPERYRDLVEQSFGELSCAKHVYVALRTGWSSTRTACYLAAGRPAVVQDTGFSDHVPTGVGLLPFDDADVAVERLQQVEADYAMHSAGAVDVAAECFSAPLVLQRLLDDCGARTRPAAGE